MESMRLHLGTLTTAHSRLSVYASVEETPAGMMTGTVHLWCSEIAKDRAGYLILKRPEMARLRELLDQAESTITGLAKTGKLMFVADGLERPVAP